MTELACLVCTRHPPTTGYVCNPCRQRVTDQLRGIVDLAALAAAQIEPAAGRGIGRTPPASKPPINVAALDAALGIDALVVLESWQRAVRADYGLVPYGVASEANPATLGRCVDFLLTWWPRLADSWPPVDDLAREVGEVWAGLRHWHPDHQDAGTRIQCPGEHPADPARDCDNWLHVIDHDVHCRRCGTDWTADRLIRVGLAVGNPVWVDLDTAAAWTGVPSRTLRRWAEQGHIARERGRYDVTTIRARHTGTDGP